LRVAVVMLALQASIGALNDLVDAPRDAVTKPGKPIPRGAASAAEARMVTMSGLALGVVLLLPSGPAALAVLAVGAACGYAYDLRLSRTAWSWLPLAIALPLVPAFAWAGATGTVPATLLGLFPAGLVAGAGLALANGLADLERDASTGARSAAVRLGRDGTWLLHGALLAAAVVSLVVVRPVALLAGGPSALVLGAGVLALLVGLGLGRSGGAQRRERAWELEAIGVAVVAGGWLLSLASG